MNRICASVVIIGNGSSTRANALNIVENYWIMCNIDGAVLDCIGVAACSRSYIMFY